MSIAVLGMGRMGKAVASRLLGEGHDLVVWNRSPGRTDDLVERGAVEAASPADAARRSEVVITSLTDDAAVLAVVTGDDGVTGGLDSRAVYVDMSTVSAELAAKLTVATNGRHLASPILGGPSAVEAGEAGYLVAGPRQLYEQVSDVYSALTDRPTYLGEDARLALQLKLLANYLLLAGIVVASEVIATAEAIGFPEDTMRGFLGNSPLVAQGLRNRLDGLFASDHEGWFTTALGAKDVALAAELATREGLRLPVADLVKRRYEEAAAGGFEGNDLTAVIELLRKQR